MRHTKQILCTILLLSMGLFVCAQEIIADNTSKVKKTDSVKVSKHNPTTAMLYSIIPGGGQIYNRKYWKIPIIYAALGTTGYFTYHYASQMKTLKTEFINRRDGHTELLNPQFANQTDANILASKQTAQRNMEIFIAASAVIYALNIIDAMVDAHLFYFDVSDDLSLQWSPSMVPTLASRQPAWGVGINLKFK